METNLDFLRAELSVLLVHDFKFSDSSKKLQEGLKKRFNKEYFVEDIEKEFEILKVENDAMWDEANNTKEIPEDYFEGY